MRQFVAILQGGALVGLVLDPSPILPAATVAAWTRDGYGCRAVADVRRAARRLEAVAVVELVHRPARESLVGVHRRYPERTYCRPVAA